MPEELKKSPSETFTEMMKNFGSAMAEIFNDPKLKEKAKEFGESAADSAKAFAGRFKDEEVKDKFKDLGKAAKTFGESVSDYFKDDKEKTGSGQSDAQQGSQTSGGTQSTDSQTSGDAQSTGSQTSADEESKKKPENGPGSETTVQTEKNRPDVTTEKPKKYESDRNSRIAGYSAAIAWGIILIIFFNFFNKYIAFYTYDAALKTWSLTPMLTENFRAWLPIFNVSMIVSILGSIILIINDSFYFNNITNIVMNIFGISSVVTLLTLFPFDFKSYQGASLDPILFPIFKIGLALVIVGLAVGVFVRFIKIVIKIAKAS
jgi:hypothetical protein